jgi:hypothetical protein
MAMVVLMIMFLLSNIAADLGRCESPFRTMSGMRAGIMPVRIPVTVAFLSILTMREDIIESGLTYVQIIMGSNV